MDTSKDYIKMCEKAEEIQKLWRPPNGANMPDYAYSYSHTVYKRSSKRGNVSHFELYDYLKENPKWIEYNGNVLGGVLARHWSGRNNFIALDSSYPGGNEGMVEIRGAQLMEYEQWLPQTELIWLPRQDQLQEMCKKTWPEFDADCARVSWNNKSYITKEQAGIQVVMKENHNKTWNGEEWVSA